MRVRTKYGDGTLIGVCANDGIMSYKVQLDNTFTSDLPDDEKELNEIKKTEDRIYNCISVKVLSDDGKEIEFGKEIRVL